MPQPKGAAGRPNAVREFAWSFYFRLNRRALATPRQARRTALAFKRSKVC
jgi:hypothetical protein